MAEILTREENLDCLLFLCLYCDDDYRNDSMFWEEASNFFFLKDETEKVRPDDYSGYLPDAHSSFCSEGTNDFQKQKDGGKEKVMESFFIVSNRGCLFGKSDDDQRL